MRSSSPETQVIDTTASNAQQVSASEPGDLKQALNRQVEEAREEAGRFDHGEIEEGNREYIDQVKVVRKRHRKNKEVEDLQADSDVDDDFKTGLLDAANRFG